MKVRKSHSQFLLLFFSTYYIAFAYQSADQSSLGVKQSFKRDQLVPDSSALVPNSNPLIKDAPVDGKDGKPKVGPWVETSVGKEKKETKQESSADIDAELVATKPKGMVDYSVGKLKDAGHEEIPNSNDGVMDDSHRPVPKKGTTGIGGGISAKEQQTKVSEAQNSAEKAKGNVPTAPEVADEGQLHRQERKMKAQVEDADTIGADSSIGKGLEEESKVRTMGCFSFCRALTSVPSQTPNDLPETLQHEKPRPKPATLPKDYRKPGDADSSSHTKPDSSTSGSTVDREDEGIIQPFHSFVLAMTMILFSEIGDKTFLVAALMAMRHPRLQVFTAAFSALIAMTVLSAVLGHAVPTLLPKRFTSFLAAVLFLVFGAKFLKEGLQMSPNEGIGEEMREVEQELEEKEHEARKHGHRRTSNNISPYALEAGRAGGAGSRRSRSISRLPSIPRSPSSSSDRSPSPERAGLSGMLSGLNNLLSLLLSPAWVQTFAMTFLGEWGDRSQIATIAMAAGQDYWWVTGGAISGHALCTAAAVLGGRAVAGKVSMRVGKWYSRTFSRSGR